ncbi:MAG: histidine phosphotransferase family protein [Pseudomonadota bacterium]
MGKSETDLAALIGSRICHDLISPIGAINNGLELLGMAGQAGGAELDLITQSVENASARIRFFRIAYGAAGKQLVGRAEVVSTLKDYSAGGRLEMAWGPLEPHPRSQVRLAFLALQCLESAMPYGGRVDVTQAGGAWTLTGQADKLNVDAALWSILEGGPVSDVSPSQVQFALLATLGAEAGRQVRVTHDGAHITLSF